MWYTEPNYMPFRFIHPPAPLKGGNVLGFYSTEGSRVPFPPLRAESIGSEILLRYSKFDIGHSIFFNLDRDGISNIEHRMTNIECTKSRTNRLCLEGGRGKNPQTIKQPESFLYPRSSGFLVRFEDLFQDKSASCSSPYPLPGGKLLRYAAQINVVLPESGVSVRLFVPA